MRISSWAMTVIYEYIGILNPLQGPDWVCSKVTSYGIIPITQSKFRLKCHVWLIRVIIRHRDVMPLIEEIKNSHRLLFGRSPASRRLARRFYGVPVFKWKEYLDLSNFWWEELSHIQLDPFDAENVPIAELLEKFPWLAERMV